MLKKISLFLLILISLSFIVSAEQVCEVYDDFSSPTLDTDKWEIRRDVEGQPFIEEYWVDTNLSNFHTQQNTIGDKRVYLVPRHTFTTGDVLEYDTNLVSKENNYMQMVLLTGDQYVRIGIFGYVGSVQGFDELGNYHIKFEFQENNLRMERTSPSNVTLVDNLALTNANGNYELYIGSVSGHNGRVHIDYDNFVLCTKEEEPPQPDLEERVAELEQKVEDLENRTSFLETLVNKIVEWIKSLPNGFSKLWQD